jgi:hypothetical protein
MSKSQLCFWFCFTDICLKIASFLYALVLVANNSLNFATPGFLRAGDSDVIFDTLRLLLDSKDTDMWQGVSSCLGFLLRRDSWHPQWCCKMLISI